MADNFIKNNYESEDFFMTKIRDYNMNGTIILGVDAGYGNYKTARCCFPTSVSRSDQPPVFTGNYLEYEGGYYTKGEGIKILSLKRAWTMTIISLPLPPLQRS